MSPPFLGSDTTNTALPDPIMRGGLAGQRATLAWLRISIRCWLICLAISCACSLIATTRTHALAPAVHLRWQAPAGCPDQAEMERRVAQLLSDDALPKKLSATAEVTKNEAGYRAQLSIQTEGGIGQRTLDHSQCEILADSAALVIVLSANRTHASSGASRTKLVFGVSAHASLVRGVLPRFALGGGLGLALEGWASLRWEISASYYAAQSATYEALSVGADFRLLRVAARSCRIWTIGRLDLAPCVGAQLYRIDGAGFGGVVESSGGSFVWGPEVSVLLRLQVWRRLSIQLSAGAAWSVSRQRFTYGDLGLLHRPDAFAYQALLAPEVRF